MSRTIMLIPIDTSVSLTSISLGIAHLMKQKKINLVVFKPIAQSYLFNNRNQIAEVLRSYSRVQIVEPLDMSYVKSLLVNNQKDSLMEAIIARYHDNIQQAEVILIEGLVPTSKYPFAQSLNYDISKMLGADIIFVTALGSNTLKQLKERIQLLCVEFGGIQNKNITGVIINELNLERNLLINEYNSTETQLLEIFNKSTKTMVSKDNGKDLTNDCPVPILGYIPWNIDLITTRAIDIANNLNATIINEGALQDRRIKSVMFCTCNISNTIELFSPESLLVTSSDRYDIIVSICLAVMNGIKIGAVLLTNGYPIANSIYHLCHNAFKTGLPLLMVETNTVQTLLNLQNFNLGLYIDNYEGIEKIKNYIALHINQGWINSLTTDSKRPKVLSPPTFRYQLTQLAHKANKCIVLPEGDEPRTVKAAAICAKRNIAKCILLGEPNKIKQVADAQEIELGPGVEIIVPKFVRENYVKSLIELRKNKGMTEIIARKQLEDNVVLGTMMLEKNEVDGLVSGAIHTTANTVRPALQLIKTTSGNSIVSSVFFMLLPEQVLVYADCAINPNPTIEQLSEIAIQSADSAKIFGIEPRIAMISYSTGSSSTGSDVNKVRDATLLVQEKRPDLIIDGPLQYDAAIMADVAKFKAPNSPVAGQATVFIFPDLNTGNTTYKAVQRSANIVSIGPILQGLRKPVNDLSRGALVDDIVYTIAISAIQATQK